MKIYLNLTHSDVNKLIRGLIYFEIWLAVIFIADTLANSPAETVHLLFNLDGEANIPTWFSSIQLFVIGALFWLIGRQAPDTAPGPSPAFLMIVGTGFVFLSLDEAAAFHEKISLVLKGIEQIPRFKGGHGIWMFLYLIMGVPLCFVSLREFRAMWKHHRGETRTIMMGIAVFLTGAVGLEIIGYQFLKNGPIPIFYRLEVVFEEFFEMCGASIILYGAISLALCQQREMRKKVLVRANKGQLISCGIRADRSEAKTIGSR